MKTMQKRNRKILYWCGPALLLTSVFQAHSFELRLPCVRGRQFLLCPELRGSRPVAQRTRLHVRQRNTGWA